MMKTKYDFDVKMERGGSYAVKYDSLNDVFGRESIIPLWVADMDFTTAQPIIDALQERVAHGIFGYTTTPFEFFDAVRLWQNKRNQYNPKVESMSFAPGVVSGIRNYLRAFAAKGDAVIIQEPVYFPFRMVIELLGLRTVVSRLKCENGYYTMDFEDFEQKVKAEKVKFFVLCSPHNPVGRVWKEEELRKIGEICVRHGVSIISDEIHGDLILSGNKHIPMPTVSPEIAAATTVCTSSSKTFNLAGLQASTIILPSVEMKQRYDKVMGDNEAHSGNCFTIAATVAACQHGDGWLEQLLEYIGGNLKFISEYLEAEIPQLSMRVPEGTYLGWIDAKKLNMTDNELFRLMVDRAGVGFDRGDKFGGGGSGFLRINAATQRSVLEQAMRNVKCALK